MWFPWFRKPDLSDPHQLGKYGEAAAARFLRRKGFRIVARRVNYRQGEIDLVARHGNSVVFVEVKSRLVSSPEEADCLFETLEQVDREKRRRLIHAANRFMQQYRLHKFPCRFDVVAVIWKAGQKSPTITHIPNAFSVDDGVF